MNFWIDFFQRVFKGGFLGFHRLLKNLQRIFKDLSKAFLIFTMKTRFLPFFAFFDHFRCQNLF
ncbi:hypothetical protein BT_1428 [Bartonella tribocorum CIP 105476]|uniref:Uncharacterized protein n=1 Tax=Bartonella tribocorum (strain DSM 28219 / CCUG 45778 / CIP 105476 / IBS 506) TaxID=382640 RepID=A9IV20_BART1|nr:hypothetical protein BT_1263 [Bartonella tribocorum CIP 105476]CAK01786.1 hypothetical protein BT_1428 [Bartonella tribocorum CIP 105476]